MGQDRGRIHSLPQEAVEPSRKPKADGGASTVFGAFFLAVTLLIGTWELLPGSKVDSDRGKPAPQLVDTRENGCASSSGGLNSPWNCRPESTTTSP